MTDATAAVAETPALSEEDAMGALYDTLTADGVTDEPEEATEDAAPEIKVEEKPETVAEIDDPAPDPAKVDAPTDLPSSIRAKWADMPEDARDAVLSSHRELTRKMADQGRIVQSSKPVYDVLVRAAQEIPTLKDMTPDQIATDVFKMAQIQGQLAADPVNTLLGIAKQYGALDAMKQAIGGQNPSQAAQENVTLMQEIRQLRSQLQSGTDPRAIEDRINQTLTVRETERMVSEYATQKEYWGDVEPLMPQFIPMAQQRLGEGASTKDVLDAAYDMAIHAIPDLRTKATVPAKAQTQPDPARTQAQLKAKSVNVKSTSSGKSAPMTEEQRLAAIWDKHHN
jgi:hypothetical protein